MIPLKKFLSGVQENAARIHGYQEGHSGKDGVSDCIGLIIGAQELAGMKWTGTHGCNWAKRNAMSTFEPLDGTGSIFVGQIVYKSREPGEPKYALPDHYKNSGDLRDYYHIGVVTSVNPFVISHCSTGGMNYDTKLGAWRWGGKLKYVDYSEREGEGMEVPYQAIAAAASGSKVNLRAQPDKKSTLIGRVNIGDTVTVLDELDGWAKITYHGKTGYMMDQYLLPIKDEGDGDQDEDTVTVPRETLDTWADVLEEMAADIRELLGQG